MDRQRAKDLYSDYIEGELDAAEEAELEAYLETDNVARAEVEALRKTLSSLFSLRASSPPAPANLAKKVERRIQRRSRGRFFSQDSQKLLWRIPFEWISFIVILLLLALYMTTVLEGRKKGAIAPPSDGNAEQSAPKTAPKSKAPSPSTETDRKKGETSRGGL
ncbi:MAG: hypothetical protein KAI47_20005 [Deltaproteobacteria bacterium]|nr:hypothetical protein [Deltaproteobacteria bacterium]